MKGDCQNGAQRYPEIRQKKQITTNAGPGIVTGVTIRISSQFAPEALGLRLSLRLSQGQWNYTPSREALERYKSVKIWSLPRGRSRKTRDLKVPYRYVRDLSLFLKKNSAFIFR
jgi:hypothetical protein